MILLNYKVEGTIRFQYIIISYNEPSYYQGIVRNYNGDKLRISCIIYIIHL